MHAYTATSRSIVNTFSKARKVVSLYSYCEQGDGQSGQCRGYKFRSWSIYSIFYIYIFSSFLRFSLRQFYLGSVGGDRTGKCSIEYECQSVRQSVMPPDCSPMLKTLKFILVLADRQRGIQDIRFKIL